LESKLIVLAAAKVEATDELAMIKEYLEIFLCSNVMIKVVIRV